jgi:hypothetical protein
LVGTVFGRFERLLAIRAAARRENHFPKEFFGPYLEEIVLMSISAALPTVALSM